MAYSIEADRPEVGALTNTLAFFGLATFAISFPLVRVLVDAPEFFVAHGLGPAATVSFFAVVVLVVPLAAAAAASLPGRFGAMAQRAVLAVLALLAAAGVLQPISGLSVLFSVAVVIGAVVIVAADARSTTVRSTCAYLSVLALLLAAWVVGPSRVGSYLRSSDAALVEEAAAPHDTPVVVVVLDEMSMTATLTRDLQINAVRFPNLAALAGTSHWFRNASSVSPQTSASVPAILSGTEPDLAKVPVASQYPSNIFLQLGRSYEAHAYEPITALCPATVCGAEGRHADAPASSARKGSSYRAVLRDASVVYRHAVGSDAIRAGLPPISQGWAGFGGAADASGVLSTRHDDVAPAAGGYGTFRAQVRELADLAAVPPSSERPQLKVAHLIAPHMPWISLPGGEVYAGATPRGLTADGGTLTWGTDDGDRRAGFQRYLLQLGALDRQLGAVRQELTEQGTWDGALVVVVADHGVQFEPGGSRAVGAGGAEVTNVPLFIKVPGQTEGTVDDRAVLTIDVLPTILGLLDIESPSHFDGLDVFAAKVPKQRRDAFLAASDQSVTPDQTLDALRSVVERRARWVDPDAGWEAVYQAGVASPLVGQALDSIGPTGAGGATWRRAAGEQGVQVTVEALSSAAPPSTLLYVCGGTIAAAAPSAPAADAPVATVYPAPQHCADPDAGELWLLDGNGTVQRAEERR